MKKYIFILCLIIIFFSCKKQEDPVYEINEVQATPYNANKNKLKSTYQHILIMYANLFQKALSPNELVGITRCIESIGDKQIALEKQSIENLLQKRAEELSVQILSH